MVKTIKSLSELNKLPKIVYKYRNWEDEYHKTVITKRQVFFAPPKSFEDPLDCKNPIRYDLLTKQDIFNKYFSNSLRMNPFFTNNDQHLRWAQEWARKSPLNDHKYLKMQSEKTFELYNARFGVLSLTKNLKNIEMWNKYSNNSRGFCLGFNPKIMFEHLGGGGPVEYVKELPVIMPTPIHSMAEQHSLQVFKKLRKWSFEEEYRTHKFRKEPLTPEQRIVTLPHDCFVEIILGFNMPEELENQLRNSVPTELKDIEIKKSKLVDDKIEF